MYVIRNIEACSCNHCCSKEAVSTAHSECVLVALGIHQATRMRHIYICGLLDSTGLSKKVTEHEMCFDFLYKFCLKYFKF